MSVYRSLLLLVLSNMVRFASQLKDQPSFVEMPKGFFMTDDFLISAAHSSKYQELIIIADPYPWGTNLCRVPYQNLLKVDNSANNLRFIYLVVISSKSKNKKNVVALIGRDRAQNNLYLIILRLTGGVCHAALDVKFESIPLENLNKAITLAVDPPGEQVCMTLLYSTICLDTHAFRHNEYANENLWDNATFFISYGLIFTEDRRLLLVAYRYDEPTLTTRPYLYVVNFSDPSRPVKIGRMPLSIEHPWENGNARNVEEEYMSIAVHEDSQTMIISMPHIDTVYLFSYRNTMPVLISTHISPEKDDAFGQSVAM